MRRIAGGLVLVALVALGGCTADEPDPSPTTAPPVAASATPTTTPSPTPSPTPTPTAAPTSGPDQDVTIEPTKPAALDGPATEDNAIAVARYMLTLFPYMVATGDTTAWDAISGDNCAYCENSRQLAVDIRDAGNRGTGGAFEIGLTTARVTGNGHYFVEITYTETPSQTVAPDGTVVEDFPDTYELKILMKLRHGHGTWTLVGADVEEFGEHQ